MGSFDTATLRGKGGAVTSPGDRAQRIKEQATALHRAGEYDEAAREFARAAELLEAAGGALAPPPALSAIRLSLAAAQLKVSYSCPAQHSSRWASLTHQPSPLACSEDRDFACFLEA